MIALLGYIAAAGPGNVADYKRPVWSCGHEHETRGEAIACLAAQKLRAPPAPQRDDPGDSEGEWPRNDASS